METEMTDIRKIAIQIAQLRRDMETLKKHVTEVEESVLTEEDLRSLDKAEEDLRKGKTKRI
ncbi:MAG: hypothetical protein AABY16_01330 [Nanoarchaeota archaeon]